MDEGAEAVHGFSWKLYELSDEREFIDFIQKFMPDFYETDL